MIAFWSGQIIQRGAIWSKMRSAYPLNMGWSVICVGASPKVMSIVESWGNGRLKWRTWLTFKKSRLDQVRQSRYATNIPLTSLSFKKRSQHMERNP